MPKITETVQQQGSQIYMIITEQTISQRKFLILLTSGALEGTLNASSKSARVTNYAPKNLCMFPQRADITKEKLHLKIVKPVLEF